MRQGNAAALRGLRVPQTHAPSRDVWTFVQVAALASTDRTIRTNAHLVCKKGVLGVRVPPPALPS